MKNVALILLMVLPCQTGAFAQDAQSETEWRKAVKEAESKRSSGNKLRLLGLGLTLGGLGLAVAEPSAVRDCMGPTGGLGPCPSEGAMRTWVGLGVSGAGVFSLVSGMRKENAAGRRLKELNSIGKQQGWRVELLPLQAGVRVAFGW